MNANELREAMAKLPEPKTDLKPPYWEYWRWDLWQRIVNGGNPENFMLWPCVYHTMLVDHWPDVIRYEADALFLTQDINILNNATKFSQFPISGNASLSQNAYHQAYHIYQWEKATGKKVNELNSIVEFGGGYGAMALVCRRLGFTGEYYIYDLPEFALLQQWFLSQNGVEGIKWWEQFTTPIKRRVGLLVGLYSLSETPITLRQDFLSCVKAKSYLFLYSGQWESYDNVKYFQEDVKYLTNIPRWGYKELTHLPDRNNWYSIGW